MKELKYKIKEKEKQRREKYRKKYWKRHNKEYNKKHREILKEKIIEKLGNSCSICNKKPKRLVFHEIHGKPHPSQINYLLEHVEDFIAMCNCCHNRFHWCLNNQKKVMELLQHVM